MLARLGIGQKLVALAALPMVAVLLTVAPIVVERARDAGLARATAQATSTARDVGVLIQDLQQERLLALAYLTSTQLDRTALVAQSATADADLARLRSEPGAGAVVNRAGRSLSNLAAVRSLFLDRTITAEAAYQAYRRAIGDLVDELRLTNPPGVDVDGVRQLQALDQLTRANEEAASVGATLVAAAGDLRFPVELVNQAVTAQGGYTHQLASLVSTAQAQLLDLVEKGKAGERITELIGTVNRADRGSADLTVADALSAAISYTTLRQVAQDRITRDVASAATSRSTAAQRVAYGVGAAGLILLLLVFLLARTISRSIARPLRQLTRAATDVAALAQRQLVRIADTDVDDPTPLRLPDVDISSSDEIGELAAAFNQVQATATALVEQQANSRRNVAVMFGNIARRTQNLVGRQRSQLQALHRLVTDPRAVEQLTRLDQQRTQLRRSADSLLVVSGIVDQGAGGSPALLADVVSGLRADLDPESRVRVGMMAPVAVTAGFVDDLRLILGELLSNALNFSPPGTVVELSAERRQDLTIQVVDHGLGLTAERLAEENRRLVDRERLDVAPTSVLGLFVVGRLARRHDLTVHLSPTMEGGVTVVLRVPTTLFAPAAAVDVVRRASDGAQAALPAGSGRQVVVFHWFGPAAGTAELPALPAWPPHPGARNGDRPVDAPITRTASWPAVASPQQPAAITGNGSPPGGSALDAWAAATAPGWAGPANGSVPGAVPAHPNGSGAGSSGTSGLSADGSGAGESRAGLTRRRPGQHMQPGLLGSTNQFPAREQRRDPESERAQLDSLFAGFERGETAHQPPVPSEPPLERPS